MSADDPRQEEFNNGASMGCSFGVFVTVVAFVCVGVVRSCRAAPPAAVAPRACYEVVREYTGETVTCASGQRAELAPGPTGRPVVTCRCWRTAP